VSLFLLFNLLVIVQFV